MYYHIAHNKWQVKLLLYWYPHIIYYKYFAYKWSLYHWIFQIWNIFSLNRLYSFKNALHTSSAIYQPIWPYVLTFNLTYFKKNYHGHNCWHKSNMSIECKQSFDELAKFGYGVAIQTWYDIALFSFKHG